MRRAAGEDHALLVPVSSSLRCPSSSPAGLLGKGAQASRLFESLFLSFAARLFSFPFGRRAFKPFKN